MATDADAHGVDSPENYVKTPRITASAEWTPYDSLLLSKRTAVCLSSLWECARINSISSIA